MTAYYNENSPYAAAWLRSLIAARLIPDGRVDERSIADVLPEDLDAFTQVHLFAGLGGWPLALRLAAWPDRRPILTGSCPCQPFSVAGKGLGSADARHLWPHMFRLVRALRPPVIMGEQVAGAAGYGWLDGVHADLASENYACEAVDIPAGSVNAPHIRNRIYWLAHPDGGRCGQPDARVGSISVPDAHQSDVRLDHAASPRCFPAGCDPMEALRDGAWSGQPERRSSDGGDGPLADSGHGLLPLPRRGPEGRDGPRPAGPLPGWMGDPEYRGREGRNADGEGAGAALPSGEAPLRLDHAASAGRPPDGWTGEPRRSPDDAPGPSEDGGLADPDSERRQQIPGSAPCDEAADGGARRDALEPRSDHQPSGDDEGPLLPDRSHADPRPVGDPDLDLPGDGLLQRSRQLGGPRLDPQVDPGIGPWDEWTLVGPDPSSKYRRVKPGVRLLAHGIPSRVAKLRALGNAIVPPLAAEVIRAYMETHQ